jgi:hypothetical protein
MNEHVNLLTLSCEGKRSTISKTPVIVVVRKYIDM